MVSVPVGGTAPSPGASEQQLDHTVETLILSRIHHSRPISNSTGFIRESSWYDREIYTLFMGLHEKSQLGINGSSLVTSLFLKYITCDWQMKYWCWDKVCVYKCVSIIRWLLCWYCSQLVPLHINRSWVNSSAMSHWKIVLRQIIFHLFNICKMGRGYWSE